MTAYILKHYARDEWLDKDGIPTSDITKAERFVRQGGATRWLMHKAPDFLNSYRTVTVRVE